METGPGNQRRPPPLQGQSAEPHANASAMMRLMVRAHRPHCALQPRQVYTSPALRTGELASITALRTSWSLSTLQEQTIMIASQQAPTRRLVRALVEARE
jgi:hypothetical protein